MNTAIVVVAFNRLNSLERLLSSLKHADYPTANIPLIISIDRAPNNQDVLECAENFVWKHGDKKVIYQEKKLGLRPHVLKCGSLSKEYGSVIILEDDLFVAPGFYNYAVKALQFSEDKEYIGGISLYTHHFNVECCEPFYPYEDGYDNWYFQFASSWGQAWTYNQWSRFYSWYGQNCDKDLHDANTPEYVASWPKSSWLKYYIKYLIETNRYFLYPRISLTTNFADAGTNILKSNSTYQVSLLWNSKKEWSFSEIEDSQAIYDAFFENIILGKKLYNNAVIDLYAKKPVPDKGLFLSRKHLNYHIVSSYGCCMRPHECNILMKVKGNDFFLYDLGIEEHNDFDSNSEYRMNLYRYKVVLRDRLWNLIKLEISNDFHRLQQKLKIKFMIRG